MKKDQPLSILKNKKVSYFMGFVMLFILFVGFSYFVHKNKTTQIDFDTTVRIQDNIPIRFDNEFSWLSFLFSFELSTIYLLIILIVGSIKGKKLHRILLVSFYLLFHVVELLGKSLIEHQGPPFMFLRNTFGFHFPSGYISADYFSYPSGHVGRTVFLAGLLSILVWQSKWNMLRKLVSISMLAGFCGLMVVSRIYLGEHWVSDTIGGAFLGSSFALLTMVFW